jgi:hypothetical protein
MDELVLPCGEGVGGVGMAQAQPQQDAAATTTTTVNKQKQETLKQALPVVFAGDNALTLIRVSLNRSDEENTSLVTSL